jgi:hypothetical protein
MSKMSELHIQITEAVHAGYSRDDIIAAIAEMGIPRVACENAIDAIAGDIDTRAACKAEQLEGAV